MNYSNVNLYGGGVKLTRLELKQKRFCVSCCESCTNKTSPFFPPTGPGTDPIHRSFYYRLLFDTGSEVIALISFTSIDVMKDTTLGFKRT
jgi:hypothetical protein